MLMIVVHARSQASSLRSCLRIGLVAHFQQRAILDALPRSMSRLRASGRTTFQPRWCIWRMCRTGLDARLISIGRPNRWSAITKPTGCCARPIADTAALPDTGQSLSFRPPPPCTKCRWQRAGQRISFILLVGAGRFERPTPCAQGRFRTQLKIVCFQLFSLQWVTRAVLNGVELDGTLVLPSSISSTTG
jgi:hypothetical protein